MASKITYDPEMDIPDLAGKVFLITGGRNAKNAAQVAAEVKAIAPSAEVTFIHCDQTSLASVDAAAKEFLSKSDRLDVLLCNAGVMAIAAGTTQDGYENQFGTNHVAHALLVKKLLPALQQTAKETGDARIVFLTSLGFAIMPSGGIVFKDLKSPQSLLISGPWLRYGQSKLANIVYASELAKRYPDVTTVAIHPGGNMDGHRFRSQPTQQDFRAVNDDGETHAAA